MIAGDGRRHARFKNVTKLHGGYLREDFLYGGIGNFREAGKGDAKLCSWTLKFRKSVLQQIWGEVEITGLVWYDMSSRQLP